MRQDWWKHNFWRGRLMRKVARIVGQLDSWLWRKMWGRR